MRFFLFYDLNWFFFDWNVEGVLADGGDLIVAITFGTFPESSVDTTLRSNTLIEISIFFLDHGVILEYIW